MKAFLLAAGRGARLKPLTDRTPKCLLRVAGLPLLEIWLRLLRAHGIRDVLLNTHHLAERVNAFVRRRDPDGIRVTLFHEPVLLGSAGTVAANRDFVRGEKSFLIAYADNLTDLDLGAMIRFHQRKRSPFTLGLFPTPTPEACGIAECAPDGRVASFVEKPRRPAGNLANAGLYVARQELFAMMPAKPFLDFGFDVLPRLVGRMYGYRIEGFFCDIGARERLAYCRRAWPARARLR